MADLVSHLKSLKRDEKKVPQYFGRLTYALDLLSFQHNEAASEKSRGLKEAKFLCFEGDLKHVIRTVAAGGDPVFEGSFSFSLVDANPHIQAKNILLLYILLKTRKTKRAVLALISVMYSLHLDEETAHLLDTALRHLLEEGLQAMEGVNLSGVGLSRVREVWEAWLGAEPAIMARMEQLHRAKAEMRQAGEVNDKYLDGVPEGDREAVQRWIYSGDFGGKEDEVEDQPNVTLTCLNPLLTGEKEGRDEFEVESEVAKDILSSDRLVHAPHAIDSPYQDWDYLEVTEHFGDDDLEVAYTKYIRHLASIVRDVYKEGKLSVDFVLSPLETVSRFVHEYHFDRILTGNSADIHGTAKILSVCEPFLSLGNRSASILTHHRIWRLLVPGPDQSLAFSEFLRAEYLLGLELAGCDSPADVKAEDTINIGGMALCKNTVMDVSLKVQGREVSMPEVGMRNLQWVRMRNKQAEEEDEWSRMRNNTSICEDGTEECSGVFFASPVKVEEDEENHFTFEEDQNEDIMEEESKEVSTNNYQNKALATYEQKGVLNEAPEYKNSYEKHPTPPRSQENELDLIIKDDVNPHDPKVPVKKKISKNVTEVINRFTLSSPTSPDQPIRSVPKVSTGRSPKFFHVKLDDIPKKHKNPLEKVRDDTPLPSPDLNTARRSQNKVKALASKFGGTDDQNNKSTRISTPSHVKTEGKFLFNSSDLEELSFEDNGNPPEIIETIKIAPRKSSLSVPKEEKRRISVSFDEHPNIIPESVDENNNSGDEEERNGHSEV